MGFEPAFIWSFKLLLLASGTVALLSSFVMRGSVSKAESMVFMSMVILGLSAWPLAVTMLSGYGASLAAVLPLAASLIILTEQSKLAGAGSGFARECSLLALATDVSAFFIA